MCHVAFPVAGRRNRSVSAGVGPRSRNCHQDFPKGDSKLEDLCTAQRPRAATRWQYHISLFSPSLWHLPSWCWCHEEMYRNTLSWFPDPSSWHKSESSSPRHSKSRWHSTIRIRLEERWPGLSTAIPSSSGSYSESERPFECVLCGVMVGKGVGCRGVGFSVWMLTHSRSLFKVDLGCSIAPLFTL